MKQKKISKILLGAVMVMGLCFFLAGCSPLKKAIENYSGDKEKCILSEERVTEFSYKENNYTILDETVSNSSLGEWVGYIRQYVAVSEDGKILEQNPVDSVSADTIKNLLEQTTDTTYILPFFNVYAAPNDASCLFVDVNGSYHKAVDSNYIKDWEPIFDYKTASQNTNNNDYKINPENATQIICGDTIYQVTTQIIPKNRLGKYISVLAEKVTFDTSTKQPLSQSEINEIDWSGQKNTERENWIYKEIYEIIDTEPKEAIAVTVNNQYHFAEKQ